MLNCLAHDYRLLVNEPSLHDDVIVNGNIISETARSTTTIIINGHLVCNEILLTPKQLLEKLFRTLSQTIQRYK